jgi:hypothetical protein
MFDRNRIVRASIAVAIAALLAAPAHATVSVRAPADTEPTAKVPTCTPASRTGIYRVSLTRTRTDPMPGMLVFERAAGCLSGLLITERAHAALDNIVLEGDVMTATVRTESGLAKMSLKFTTEGVTGALTQGKKIWNVAGDRTS